MPIADWLSSEDWDNLYLGGKLVPGAARVSISCASGIDTKKPKGGKKAAQKDIGAPPAKIKVEIDLDFKQVDEFEREIVPMLRPRNVFAPRDPVEIAHPEARLWGINVVIAGQIDSSHPETGGLKRISFDLEEWAPAATNVNKGASKPKSAEDTSGWDVQSLINSLRPGRAKSAAGNLGAVPVGTP